MAKRLAPRALLGLLLAIAVYTAASVYADVRALGRSLERFAWWRILPVLLLTLLGYLLRFFKWHLLLGRVGARVRLALSAQVFVAGFSMGITPGKVGELIKAWMLRESADIPLSATAPVVVADRLTDLVALLLLCLMGASVADPSVRKLLLSAGIFVLGITALLSSNRGLSALLRGLGRLPLLGRLAEGGERLVDPMTRLLRPAPLGASTALAVLAWLCECVGFYLILAGLPGRSPGLASSTFIYSAATVLGALSFLPGGLGVTEGGLAFLLSRATVRLGRAASVAATLLVRLCTLWFGVLLGIGALLLYRRSHRALTAEPPPPSSAA